MSLLMATPKKTADSGKGKTQVNVTLEPDELAALEKYRADFGVGVRVKRAAAAREAIVRFLVTAGYLDRELPEKPSVGD